MILSRLLFLILYIPFGILAILKALVEVLCGRQRAY
jgi:hypothetical protein